MGNKLVYQANKLLAAGGFDYAFCGGFAIELFLDKGIRKHGDIDVSVYWPDRDKIILYMQSLGWNVYEMCGGGVAHHITDLQNQLRVKRNIFCFKNECNLLQPTPYGEENMFHINFIHSEQVELDFIEFLFNKREGDSFLYARNENISLSIGQAILKRGGIPYLAPELVLLYKSTDTERIVYQLDYVSAMEEMSVEQKLWLNAALKEMNPAGHKWVQMNLS